MHMDPKEPWRDWFCLASPKVLWEADYNPITGVEKPAKMGHEQCLAINGKGDCAKFERAPVEPRAVDVPLRALRLREPRPEPPAVIESPRRRWWWPWPRRGDR